MAETRGGRRQSSHVGRDNLGIVITGDGAHVHIGDREGPSQHLSNGKRHLQNHLYAQAIEEFNQAIKAGPENAELYYLSAVATLEGGKAFLAPLARIRKCETLIHCALRLESRGVFYYFLAYLAADYYERKSLRAPVSARSLLEQAWALGVTSAEIEQLFSMLIVENTLPI